MKQFGDLMVASLAYLPLVLPLLLPGVSVNSMGIAQSLLVTMILPLSIGLCIKARRESLALRMRPIMSHLSNVSILIALVLILAMNSRSLLGFMSVQIFAAATLFVGLSFAAAYLLGGPAAEARRVLGFGTAARNIPAALLVARQNFDDPQVMIMVIVVALLSLIVLAPLAIVLARRNRSQTPP